MTQFRNPPPPPGPPLRTTRYGFFGARAPTQLERVEDRLAAVEAKLDAVLAAQAQGGQSVAVVFNPSELS